LHVPQCSLTNESSKILYQKHRIQPREDSVPQSHLKGKIKPTKDSVDLYV